MDESCQECKGWGRTMAEGVRCSDAKEAVFEEQAFGLKRELCKKNGEADELKHRIGDLEEMLDAANTKLARLVEVDEGFADALEKAHKCL